MGMPPNSLSLMDLILSSSKDATFLNTNYFLSINLEIIANEGHPSIDLSIINTG
jgi:hypothetical protein